MKSNRVLAGLIALLMAGMPLASYAQFDDELADLFGDDASVSSDDSAEGEDAASDSADEPNEQTPPTSNTAVEPTEITSQTAENSNASGATRARSRLIEEVVVTAQKREEDVQDVPIMINAFSGEKLDAFGIESTNDLPRITPGLTITNSFGYNVIYMRGVGTDAFLPNADPSVATYLDGVNLTPSQGKQDTLGPVERVEVLKGPQGTLFGRNATGGAINIVTAPPPNEFQGSFKAEFGNYNSRIYSAYLGTPITSKSGATLALYKQDQDLYGRNEVGGEAGPMREDYVRGGRLKFMMFPSDSITISLWAALNEQFNGSALSQENTRPAPLFVGGVEPDPEDPDRIWHNDYQGGTQTSNSLYAGTIAWATDYGELKFIFSDNEADVDEARMDFDGTETSQAIFYSNDQYNHQTTYELQFISDAAAQFDGRLRWVAGLYRLEGEGGFGSLYLGVNALGFGSNVVGIPNLLNNVGALLGANNLGYTVNDLVNASNEVVLGNGGLLITESDAVYLQGIWSATDWLDVTLGARYQIETRGLTNSYLDAVLPTAGTPPNDYYDRHDTSQNIRVRSFNAPDLEDKTLSPKIAFQIRTSDNIQYFLSAQRAYKSPTYNIVNFFTNPDAVERETATAYEIGFKSDWMDGALRFNAAAFYTQIDGLLTALVSIGSGGIVTFRNAGEAEIKGLEFDSLWQPMPNLNPGLAISTGATLLDAKYTDYKNGSGFDDATGLYFGDDSLIGGPARDFSGNDIVRTPDLTANISINQAINLDLDSSIELGLDYYYNSGFNTTPQNSPFYVQQAYDLWSARVSYFYQPWDVQLTGFIDNATDTKYLSAMLQHDFGRAVVLSPPRTFGLRVKWNF